MKICIIGFPRSRSSILLDTVSQFYGIPILGEDINELTKNYKITPSNNQYKMLLKKTERTKNGVIRLHPFQLLEHPRKDGIGKFELFNFSQYDKIYFTYRESISDAIASEFVAESLNIWTHCFTPSVIKEPLIIPNDYGVIANYKNSQRVVANLKEYLKQNNILSEDLFYEDIPQYLEKNFSTVKTAHVKTDYNYREIVINYDDILLIYNNSRL
jgi:hypothetical protein